MKKITIHSRHHDRPTIKGLVNKKKSMTMPGQAVTPQEIIRSMTSGISSPQIYHEENLTSFQRMDFAEKADFLQELATRNKQLQDNITYQVDTLKKKQQIALMQQQKANLQQQASNDNTKNANDDQTTNAN